MFAYLFNLYMYNTVQKVIVDPINNTTNTAIVVNNVVEEESSILLPAEKEATLVEELFEVYWATGLSVMTMVELLELSFGVRVNEWSVISTVGVDQVVRVTVTTMFEELFEAGGVAAITLG